MGVHCVDCVAEAARALPATRTALGGVRHEGRPIVTLTLIGLCVVSFVLQLVLPDWTVRWLFQPYVAFFEPWRFLTAAFLHSPGQYLHIVFNMVALWFVGPTLENTLGRARYITLYLMSADRRLRRLGAAGHRARTAGRPPASVRPVRCSACSARSS